MSTPQITYITFATFGYVHQDKNPASFNTGSTQWNRTTPRSTEPRDFVTIKRMTHENCGELVPHSPLRSFLAWIGCYRCDLCTGLCSESNTIYTIKGCEGFDFCSNCVNRALKTVKPIEEALPNIIYDLKSFCEAAELSPQERCRIAIEKDDIQALAELENKGYQFTKEDLVLAAQTSKFNALGFLTGYFQKKAKDESATFVGVRFG